MQCRHGPTLLAVRSNFARLRQPHGRAHCPLDAIDAIDAIPARLELPQSGLFPPVSIGTIRTGLVCMYDRGRRVGIPCRPGAEHRAAEKTRTTGPPAFARFVDRARKKKKTPFGM